jgi:short-subunit dehydrogenase
MRYANASAMPCGISSQDRHCSSNLLYPSVLDRRVTPHALEVMLFKQGAFAQMDKTGVPDRVLVLTGASSGIGRETALAFAATGAGLVLAARNERELEEVGNDCRKAGGVAIVVPTDVSIAMQVEALGARAREHFGRWDIWINNAGAAALGRFEEIPLVDHTQVIATDLLGTIYGSHVALRHFRDQGHGTLINIASVLGEIPAPYYASYVAAKHGVVGLGAALRQELSVSGAKDIHVCTVLPMAIDTPFFENAANYTGHEAKPIPPVYDIEEVIQTLLRLADEPEGEVIVGRTGKAMAAVHAVAAGVTEKVMGAETHLVQMGSSPPAPPTAGSLHEPSGGNRHTGP